MSLKHVLENLSINKCYIKCYIKNKTCLHNITEVNQFLDCNWKPLILLPNKTDKQYASIKNHSSKLKVLQFVYCHYVSVYVCMYSRYSLHRLSYLELAENVVCV